MSAQTSRMSAFSRFAMGFQAFMLRRNWMGPMGDFVMVITVTGRKSGKRYSTPIGYLKDGDTLLGLTRSGQESNWYYNALRNPEVTLEIKGQSYRARTEAVKGDVERQKVFDIYRSKIASPETFKRLFGVLPTAAPDELQKGLATREFVRFHLIK